MNKRLIDAFEYIKTSPWKVDVDFGVIMERAEAAAQEMVAEGDFTKSKQIYRIAGQSGSGKTTQILPVILKLLEGKKQKPVIVAVRSFSKHHPQYKEIVATCDERDVRERVNAFALMCLLATLEKLIEQGYLIVFDMTVLAPEIEQFINDVIQENKYRCEYHVLAVSRSLSDFFIEERERSGTNIEKPRKVTNASKNYFYDILPTGLEYLDKVDNTSHCHVWTAYDLEPIYVGRLDGVVEAVEKGRMLDGELVYSEEQLRHGKIEFLCRQ